LLIVGIVRGAIVAWRALIAAVAVIKIAVGVIIDHGQAALKGAE
jgi:hypothetical protein